MVYIIEFKQPYILRNLAYTLMKRVVERLHELTGLGRLDGTGT